MPRISQLVPKPIFFAILGLAGCLVGWAISEPILMLLKPQTTGGQSTPEARDSGTAPNLLFRNPEYQRRMVGKAEPGDVEIALAWDNYNDLDLHCTDPDGEEIWYQHKRSASGGELDIDANAVAPFRSDPSEHIRWKRGDVKPGIYTYYVYQYGNHGGQDPTAYTLSVTVKSGNKVLLHDEFRESLSYHQQSVSRQFTVKPENQVAETVSGRAQGQGIDFREILLVSGWTALIAIPLCLALVIGQNLILRRRLLSKPELILTVVGGAVAGILSGGISQYAFSWIYNLLSQTPDSASLAATLHLVEIGQAVGWIILGSVLGLSMSIFIPNLRRVQAILGGAIGGAVGAVAFLCASHGLMNQGASGGRAIGACILGLTIGLMIALVEKFCREASLIVHWGPNEQSIINLGPTPVILGSSSKAHLYLPKEKGFPETAALVTFSNGRVEIENKLTKSKHVLQNGNKIKLGELVVEVKSA